MLRFMKYAYKRFQGNMSHDAPTPKETFAFSKFGFKDRTEYVQEVFCEIVQLKCISLF